MKKYLLPMIVVSLGVAGIYVNKDSILGVAKMQWKPQIGQQYIYNLNYDVNGRTNVKNIIKNNDLNNNNQVWETISSKIQGQFMLQAKESIGECTKMMFGWRTFSGKVIYDEQTIWTTTTPTDSMKSSIVICPEGQYKDITFSSESDVITRNIMKNILAFFQSSFILERSKSWQARENFVDHEANVQYQYLNHYATDKVNILKSLQSTNENVNIDGKINLIYSTSLNMPHQVQGERTKESHLDSLKVGEENLKITIGFQVMEKIPKGEEIKIANNHSHHKMIVTQSLSSKEDFSAVEKLEKEKLIKDQSTSDLLEALEKNYKDNDSIIKLKSILELRPEEAVRFATALSVTRADSDHFQTIASLLSEAGTVESQQALIEVMKAKEQNHDATLLNLVPYLGHAKNASMECEDYLKELANNEGIEKSIRHTAELALGTIGFNLDKNTNRSKKLFDSMSNKLLKAQDNDSKDHILQVLGNMGHYDQVNLVKDFLNEENPLKHQALRSLRNVNSYEAKEILRQELVQSKNFEYRVTAIQSLAQTKIDHETLDIYRTIIDSEKNLRILSLVIDHLISHHKYSIQATELLKIYQAKCDDLEICSKVNNVLL